MYQLQCTRRNALEHSDKKMTVQHNWEELCERCVSICRKQHTVDVKSLIASSIFCSCDGEIELLDCSCFSQKVLSLIGHPRMAVLGYLHVDRIFSLYLLVFHFCHFGTSCTVQHHDQWSCLSSCISLRHCVISHTFNLMHFVQLV